MTYRVGADVGGTFTDVILQGSDGSVSIRKLLSTPPRYDEAVIEAIGRLAAEKGAGGEIAEVIHGTTVATNAVLERRGSRIALVTTKGFRDVLELRRLRIRSGLDDRGVTGPLMIMQSSGGIMTSEEARVRPVFALESGPAAGVVAALAVAHQLGREQAISFDMGGTTAKASLIEHGDISRAREYEAGGALSAGSRLLRGGGELLRIPAIDIAEVGAGGGSIAWIDPAGGFRVGPRSAGADPGPACYGRRGTAPAVT